MYIIFCFCILTLDVHCATHCTHKMCNKLQNLDMNLVLKSNFSVKTTFSIDVFKLK